MMKLTLMRTATEKEYPELPRLKRISSLELSASEITAQVTDTSQNQLFRGDYVNQAFMVKLLKRNLLKDTNKKKSLAWAKKLSNGH